MSNEVQDQTANNNADPWTTIDPATLNGQGSFSERVNIDPTADAFKQAPPVNDGHYALLLGPSADPQVPTIQARNFPAKAEKPAMNVYRVNCSLTIVSGLDAGFDPKSLEGKMKRFDKSFSTFSRTAEGKPTNEVATILGYLGIDLAAAQAAGALTNDALVATLNSALLSGTAQIGGSTVWKAGFTKDDKNPKDFGKFLLSYQRNFPLLPGGVAGVGPYNNVVVINGVEYRAKAYLGREFFSLMAKK